MSQHDWGGLSPDNEHRGGLLPGSGRAGCARYAKEASSRAADERAVHGAPKRPHRVRWMSGRAAEGGDLVPDGPRRERGGLGPDGGRRIGLGPGSGRAGRALRGRLVPVLIRATDERDIFHLPQIEGTTQKIDFFSVVLFDTKPPLQDSKFYADFQNVIYFKKYRPFGSFFDQNCQKWSK